MEDGAGVALCATAIMDALGRKTERSSEDKNTEHEAHEIQERDG